MMVDDADDEIAPSIAELQEQFVAELRRTYSPAVIDHWLNPRNLRALEAADGFAANTGVCGDTMEMFVKVRNERIIECAFQTDGCGTTVVCGSVATELACGRTLLEALGRVSAEGILRALGGLPEASVHCAQLAAETLRRALADYLSRRNEPWKKGYRKT